MKLYFSPGACSLSPHIALHEAGLAFEPILTSTKTKKLADGSDYYLINPKGNVPLLELDNGMRLSEGPAIVQYIADLAPASKLAPAAGTMERYRLMEWLNFITSELHKGFAPLFNPKTPDAYKVTAKENLGKQFTYVENQLSEKPYLMGETFTVADAYLFTVSSWGKHVGIDIAQWPKLTAFMQRVSVRPAVQKAMQAEGLIK
jgi:glutathione S-transferase